MISYNYNKIEQMKKENAYKQKYINLKKQYNFKNTDQINKQINKKIIRTKINKKINDQVNNQIIKKTQIIIPNINNQIITKTQIIIRPKIKKTPIFKLKDEYNSIIPLNLYTCWETKNLPESIKNNFDFLVCSNPKINFHLYDDIECRQFIEENFSEDVVKIYDSFTSWSNKSTLWKYCVLYINGGIYMNLKYTCVNCFKFIALTEKEYFLKDMKQNNISTELMVVKYRNQDIIRNINELIKNARTNNYNNDILLPELLLNQASINNNNDDIKLYYNDNSCYIVKDNIIILKQQCD
jgi:mannosyltransferase OCH1-like enzyme